MAQEKEQMIAEEYLSSLMDLNVNSKPLINMLTMLAEDNIEHVHVIVRVVEQHLAKVQPECKLPILYLVDSIVKNVGEKYKFEFSKYIVNMFCGVFEKVNEKIREKLFNLRQTWKDVFPQQKLYALDVKVNAIDRNWPITAEIGVPKVHVNPNFIHRPPVAGNNQPDDIMEQMRAKERELLELKKLKIEMELLATKKKLAETEMPTPMIPPRPTVPLPANPLADMPPFQHQAQHHHGRPMRIAPANASMIRSARVRDPRLAREQPPSMAIHQVIPQSIIGTNSTKSLPKIPKLSQSKSRDAERNRESSDRDPRLRKNDSKSPKSEKSSNNSRSNKSSSSRSSSSRSNDRKKSSSDRKRDDNKKSSSSSRSKSSSHRSSSHSSSRSSRSKSPRLPSESKDSDMRQAIVDPDSTTGVNKMLDELLNGEERKQSPTKASSSSNENDTAQPAQDQDMRNTSGKKRSMGGESPDSEPANKKTKADGADILFGNTDVDLRSLADPEVEKKTTKLREKADFEAVRAKLNAAKDKKVVGVKFLNEFPSMPENPVEQVKKILGRKSTSRGRDKAKETIVEEPVVPQPQAKQPRIAEVLIQQPPPIVVEEKSDLGMTAAELRKNTEVSGLRNSRRRGTKWGEPVQSQQPSQSHQQWQPSRPPMQQQNHHHQLPPANQMNLTHFNNPLENNPLVIAMRAQSAMPLVVPQSTSQPILNTKLRTLRLDGTKDHLLRFYNETAIIFNDQGEPQDIRFSAGQCRVIIDDQFSAEMFFNDEYKTIYVDNVVHQIKFGTPTRELYIDNHFYECYFNNQTTQIVLNDKIRMVRIEGKAPEVKIGVKRNDLVLGMINIVIDAEMMIPIFLDTTVQYFEYKGRVYTLQFADFFLSVLINNEAFKVDFGGLPKNYVIHGQKHFIRFTGLPLGINPGRVNLRGMRRTHLYRNCKSPPLPETIDNPGQSSAYDNIDINHMIENDMRSEPNMLQPPIMPLSTPSNMESGIPGIPSTSNEPPSVDINDLLKKLVATGIIGGGNSTSQEPPKKTNPKEKSPESAADRKKSPEPKAQVTPVVLHRPETIKLRQQGIIDTLYLGIQCSSCGLRFPPEQTLKYSQHLDWHFRQNRRERDSKRKADHRKWYYNQSDWIKYEEIEDAEEREKNFFETQQQESTDQNEDGLMKGPGNTDSLGNYSCPADGVSKVCDMCHDEFEQFYNEENEEWHLRNAIKIDEKCYHPICYEDYKASLTLDETALMETPDTTLKEDNMEVENDDVEVKVKEERVDEAAQQSTEIDDDDVMILPNEEPVITEILDESEITDADRTANNVSVTDDDVMIQEPKIDVQIVNDDDEEEIPGSAAPISVMPVIIKVEPKDDGYGDIANDEDPFEEITEIVGDDLADENYISSPFQPALDENAVFDDASMPLSSPVVEEDEDESGSHADTNSNGAPAQKSGSKKPKIVLSSLVQNSITNKNLSNNVNDPIEKVDNDSVNKLDLCNVDSQNEVQKEPQPSTDSQEDVVIEFEVKPQLQGIKFEKIRRPVNRGIENSGLCSIM